MDLSSPSSHPQFSELPLPLRIQVTRLNSTDPGSVQEAQIAIGAALAMNADGLLATVIRDLKEFGSVRTKAAIVAMKAPVDPNSLASRIAALETDPLEDCLVWAGKAGNDPGVLSSPVFDAALQELRVRAIREVENDPHSVRDLFGRIRIFPFPEQLGVPELAAMARHFMPASGDARVLSDIEALEVLERRLPKHPPAGPFVTQLALTVSDPDWQPNRVVVQRMSRILDKSIVLNSDRDALANLCLFAATQFLDRKFSILQLGTILEIASVIVKSTLQYGKGLPAFAVLRDRLDAEIGTPMLANVPDANMGFAESYGTLAVFTGLHAVKCRHWLDDLLKAAKEAEAKSHSPQRFRALWEFARGPFEMCGYDLELATALLAQSSHFKIDGPVWPHLVSFCERVDDPDATPLDI